MSVTTEMSVTTAIMVVSLNNHLTNEWTLATLTEKGVIERNHPFHSPEACLAIKDFLEPLMEDAIKVLHEAVDGKEEPPPPDETFEVVELADDQGGPTVHFGSYDDCVEFIRGKGDKWNEFSIINTKTKRHMSYTLG